MHFTKTGLGTVIALALSSSPAVAEEVVDPGDMTKVYTQVGTSIDSDSNIRLLGSLSGSHSNGDNFLFYGDVVFGDTDFHDEDYGTAYNNARLQYFHVTNTSLTSLPKVGFSIDAIHSRLPEIKHVGDDMSIVSAGIVGMINPSYSGKFMLFPNLAYAKGEMYGESVDGVLANLFLTRRIAENRSYIGFFPEYMNVSGDSVSRESIKLKFQVGTPITDGQRLWLTATYEHQESTQAISNQDYGWSNSSRVELGFKYYL